MNTTISIIVPVFNVEQYIEKCIDSILAQTFKEFELILVNDGSEDNSGLICENYSKIDKRIKVIHKKNGGLSSARNEGLKLANGEYIAFIDSDDFIHARMYETLYKYAKKFYSDIVICDYLQTYGENQFDFESYPIDFEVENFSNIEALNQLFTEKKVQFGIVCNKLYKKSLFNDLWFEEGKIHEDEFLAHKILYRSSKVTFLPIKLYFYLQRDSGIMGSGFNICKLDAVEAYKERMEFFKNLNLTDLQKKAEFNYINLFFKYYFKAKNTIPNSEIKLMSLKRDFRKNLKSLYKNPYYNKKEKLLWQLFVINSSLYELYIKIMSNVS